MATKKPATPKTKAKSNAITRRKPRKSSKSKALTNKGGKIRRGLCAQHIKFIGLYMRNGFNATAAARDSGYAPPYRANAWRLLHTPAITAEVNRLLDKNGVSADRITIGIAEVAFGGDIADAESFLTGEQSLSELRESGALNTRTVKSVTIRKTEGEKSSTESRQVVMYDRLGALEKLAQVRGMVGPQAQQGAVGPVTVHIDVLEALRAAIDGITDKAMAAGGDCFSAPLGLPGGESVPSGGDGDIVDVEPVEVPEDE